MLFPQNLHDARIRLQNPQESISELRHCQRVPGMRFRGTCYTMGLGEMKYLMLSDTCFGFTFDLDNVFRRYEIERNTMEEHLIREY